MITRTSFLIDSRVHLRLKGLAKTNGITIGGQIRRLVDSFEGKPNYATPEYQRWLAGVVRVGSLHGGDAAEKFIQDNPAPR